MFFVLQREKVHERCRNICPPKDTFDRTLLHTHGIVKALLLLLKSRSFNEYYNILIISFTCSKASCAKIAAGDFFVTVIENPDTID